MVLKKNYLLLFIYLFICFYGFSDVPLEKILENPFSVSPLIFDNDNIYFIEQNISLKDEDIFIDYVINNVSVNSSLVNKIRKTNYTYFRGKKNESIANTIGKRNTFQRI